MHIFSLVCYLKYVLVNVCLRVHYEIYFSSHFLFVVIRTSACASANDRKENDEKNKSHNARETCVNWVIAWTKKTCPAKQINRRKFSPLCEFSFSTPQPSLASLLLLFVLKNLTCSSWCQQTENEKFSFIKHVDFNCRSMNNALSPLLNSKQ